MRFSPSSSALPTQAFPCWAWHLFCSVSVYLMCTFWVADRVCYWAGLYIEWLLTHHESKDVQNRKCFCIQLYMPIKCTDAKLEMFFKIRTDFTQGGKRVTRWPACLFHCSGVHCGQATSKISNIWPCYSFTIILIMLCRMLQFYIWSTPCLPWWSPACSYTSRRSPCWKWW